MAKTINIPDVTRDDRIGSAFNSLFSVIFSCENCSDEVIFDFAGSRFFHPFFIAPLSIYKDMMGQGISGVNIDIRLESYLSTMHFDTPLMNFRRKGYRDGYREIFQPELCSFM